MGWWAVGQHASDEYIRTYRVLISQVQGQVAKFVRSSLEDPSTPDVFGEDWVISDLTKFIQAKIPSASDEEVKRQMNKLRTFAIKGELQEVRATEFEWAEGEKSAPDAAPPPQTDEGEASQISEEETMTEKTPVFGIWIITTGVRSRRCLHIVGNCFRIPSVHYKKWCVVEDPVSVSMFRSACRSCFPRGYPLTSAPSQAQDGNELEVNMPGENELEVTSSSSDAASVNSDA
jgi:hypothetical protein